MIHLSLVGTYHEERGLASIAALLEILERIQPEVIFLEIPPAAFDDYINHGTRSNLESTAVRRYRELQDVDLVPVDLPTPEAGFFADNEDLYERVAGVHSEVRRLVGTHSRHVYEYGFAYLNSERCCALWSSFYEAMQTGINMLADPRLTERHELWKRTIELRDKEMMKNIQYYCRLTSFRTGAFLVGAQHRQRIIDMSRSQPGVDSSTMRWDFDGFLEARVT